MIVYLNGSYLDATEAKISLFDGGFLFGDGLFETIRLYAGRPFDLPGHLTRLRRELELLCYSFEPQPEIIETVLAELAARNGLADRDSLGRIILSRGADPPNLLPLIHLENLEPTFAVILLPLPEDLDRWQRKGIKVHFMKSAYARGNFPHLKTTNYLSSVMALRFAAERSCQEALLIDRNGKVLEGATSNVFIVRAELILTPPVRLGLLAGRTRALVIEAAGRLGFSVQEEAFERRELVTADEVFVTGAGKEVVPVVGVDGGTIGGGEPGPITRAIHKQYRQDIQNILAADSFD